MSIPRKPSSLKTIPKPHQDFVITDESLTSHEKRRSSLGSKGKNSNPSDNINLHIKISDSRRSSSQKSINDDKKRLNIKKGGIDNSKSGESDETRRKRRHQNVPASNSEKIRMSMSVEHNIRILQQKEEENDDKVSSDDDFNEREFPDEDWTFPIEPVPCPSNTNIIIEEYTQKFSIPSLLEHFKIQNI